MQNKKCPNCDSLLLHPLSTDVEAYKCIACGFTLGPGYLLSMSSKLKENAPEGGPVPVNALVKYPTNQLPVCGYCGSKHIHLEIEHHKNSKSFISGYTCTNCGVTAKGIQDSYTGERRWLLTEVSNIDLFRKMLMPKFSKQSLVDWATPFKSPMQEVAELYAKPEELYTDSEFKQAYTESKTKPEFKLYLESKGKKVAEQTVAKVFKYHINHPADGAVVLELPKGAVIRKLGWQDGKPTLWVEVDTETKETDTRTFQGFGTGQFVMEYVRYIDTLFEEEEGLVWHFYELADG